MATGVKSPVFGSRSPKRLLNLDFIAKLGPIEDLDGTLRPHHRDLGRGPRIVHVAPNVLGRHHVVSATIGFARDHRHLWHRGLGEGEQELRPVLDQSAIFLVGAGQEAGHVNEGHERNVEAVAEADEARGLARGVAVKYPCQHQGLIGDNADGAPLDAGEADHDVSGEGRLDLEEVAFVHDLMDQLLDVVRLVRIVRDQRIEGVFAAVPRIARGELRHARFVTRWEKVHQPAHLQQRLDVVVIGAVGDGRLRRVHDCPAKLLCRHLLLGNRLHHVRAGDEHVGGVFDHKDEVCHGRRIDVAAGARTHDHRDLRDHPGSEHVAQEHLAIAAKRRHPFLDARAARVEQPDDRRAVLQRHVLDLDHLLGVGFRQGAAEHGEVLGENVSNAAVDGAPAGDHTVAWDLRVLHTELGATMLDVHIELLEGAFVEQELQPFPRGELAARMLGFDALRPAASARPSPPNLKLFQDFLHGPWPAPLHDSP